MSRSGPWTLVLLFVFASTTLALPSTQAQLEETGTLNGMVCATSDAAYGDECWQGLPNATVSLERTDGILPHDDEATADADGRFFFDDVPFGEYTITASRAGFDDGTTNVSVDGDGHAEVRLAPQAVEVPVRVENEDGDGLDAIVSWWNDRSGGSVEVQGGDATLSTRSGYHSLEATSSGYARNSEWLLLDGSAVTLVLSKVPPQDSLLFGTVVDQDGEPVEGAVVEVYQWRGYGYDYEYEEAKPVPDGEDVPDDADSTEPASEPEPAPAPAEDPVSSSASFAPYPYEGNNRTTTGADGSYRIAVWGGEVNLNVYKEGHAQRSAYLTVPEGGELRHDVELPKFPDKTAHVEGRITGVDGAPLRYVTLSLWNPEYGLYECSVQAADVEDREGDSGNGSTGSSGDVAIEPYYPYYDRGCAITIHDDGTFEGDVTPGYTIVEAWHDHWRTCSETRSSDGSMSRTCGPEYLSHAQTLVLPADATTRLDIRMDARPAPNAFVSGYVVDAETQKAIPGVSVHFSNEETYGWGSATTDGDGSYKVKVREGHHRVSVYADGYLPWQGTIDVPADGEVALDLLLVAGQQSYGCCYAYDVAYAESAGDGVARPSAEPAPSPQGSAAAGADDGDSDGEAVQDLGGGLGPYDPEKRAAETGDADNGAPGPALVLVMLALLGAALVAIRQR